ncbi:MAG: twin-arginine translocase TatA/TatE family subunit [Sphingobacteriaceae bacterium]|nr:twin-arginine translocase TatA/TatE family subunit [Sphingobacteriaceae bacterium]
MANSLLFIGNIGGGELIAILFLIILFFGAKRIPELARGLGKGIREFKDASAGIRREIEEGASPAAPKEEKKD